MIAAALVLLLGAAPASCPQLDVGLHLGAGVARDTTGGPLDVSRAGGISAGARLDDCVGLPARVELDLVTTTLGGSGGVRSVGVSAWTGEVDLYAGLLWAWVVREEARLGGELLVGPGFQLTRTAIHVYDVEKSRFGVEVLAAVGAGVFLESIGWRISARVLAGYPRERELRFFLGVGHTIF